MYKRILQLELEHDKARAENAHLQQKVGLLERKVDQLDQYGKRPNLLIDGIPFKRNETPDTIRNAVLGEIDKLGLEIDDCEVDRAHRAEQRYMDSNGRWQQPVIVRFISWGARNVMYQSRKQSRYRYRAHLTEYRQAVLENARNRLLTHKMYAEKIDYVFADKNCTLTAHSVDGRFLGFSSDLEFDSLLSYLACTDSGGRKIHENIEQKYDRTYFNESDIAEHEKPNANPRANASDQISPPSSPSKPVTEPSSPSKPVAEPRSPSETVAVESETEA